MFGPISPIVEGTKTNFHFVGLPGIRDFSHFLILSYNVDHECYLVTWLLSRWGESECLPVNGAGPFVPALKTCLLVYRSEERKITIGPVCIRIEYKSVQF